MKRQRPKNGSHFVALIVGGVSLHARLRTQLAERGVSVGDVWSYGPGIERRVVPGETDVVILFRDREASRDARKKVEYKAKQGVGAYVIDASTEEGGTACLADIERKLDAHGYKASAIDPDVGRAAPVPEPMPPLRQPMPPLPPVAVTPSREEMLAQTGALIRKLREQKGVSGKRMGLDIGVSQSVISTLELGKRPASHQALTLVEDYLGLKRNTLPRLAERENHRLNVPPAAPEAEADAEALRALLAPAPPPATPEPEPEPDEVEAPAPPVAMDARPRGDIHDDDTLLLELAAIKRRMIKQGITRIVLTPTSFRIYGPA